MLSTVVDRPKEIVENKFSKAQIVYQKKIQEAARRRYKSLPGWERQDLEGELLEVLWLCCVKYNPDNGAGFSTYFWQSARNRMNDLHKAASAIKRQGDYSRVSLDTDAMQEQVEQLLHNASAEEEFLAKMTVVEKFASRKTRRSRKSRII